MTELPFLYTDEDRLKQVLSTFWTTLSNLRLPGSGIPTGGSDNGQLYFISPTTGAGYPQRSCRVKEKFLRENQQIAKRHRPLLSDEIIRLMKGKLEIASQVGRGTRVTITLPQEAVSE